MTMRGIDLEQLKALKAVGAQALGLSTLLSHEEQQAVLQHPALVGAGDAAGIERATGIRTSATRLQALSTRVCLQAACDAMLNAAGVVQLRAGLHRDAGDAPPSELQRSAAPQPAPGGANGPLPFGAAGSGVIDPPPLQAGGGDNGGGGGAGGDAGGSAGGGAGGGSGSGAGGNGDGAGGRGCAGGGGGGDGGDGGGGGGGDGGDRWEEMSDAEWKRKVPSSAEWKAFPQMKKRRLSKARYARKRRSEGGEAMRAAACVAQAARSEKQKRQQAANALAQMEGGGDEQ